MEEIIPLYIFYAQVNISLQFPSLHPPDDTYHQYLSIKLDDVRKTELSGVDRYSYIFYHDLRYKLLEGKLNNDKEFNYYLWEEKYQKSQLPQKGAHFQYQNIRTGQHPEKQG